MSQSKIELSDGRFVYVQAKGLKVSTRGRVVHPADACDTMSKGDRRRVRHHLDKIGRHDLARLSMVCTRSN